MADSIDDVLSHAELVVIGTSDLGLSLERDACWLGQQGRTIHLAERRLKGPINTSRAGSTAPGLYYCRAHYYNPVRQRFISENPIELRGGSLSTPILVAVRLFSYECATRSWTVFKSFATRCRLRSPAAGAPMPKLPIRYLLFFSLFRILSLSQRDRCRVEPISPCRLAAEPAGRRRVGIRTVAGGGGATGRLDRRRWR